MDQKPSIASNNNKKRKVESSNDCDRNKTARLPPPPPPEATTTTDNNDDAGVEILRENSAWDALGERFQMAASDGRYIDLTEHEPRQRGTAAAAAEFQALEAPVDPSTMVPASAAALEKKENSREKNDPPALTLLWDLINSAVETLKNVRLILVEEIERLGKNSLQGISFKRDTRKTVHMIDQRMLKIQKHVKKHQRLIMDSDAAVERVQNLNLLVQKANVLIAQVNAKVQKNARNARVQRRAGMQS